MPGRPGLLRSILCRSAARSRSRHTPRSGWKTRFWKRPAARRTGARPRGVASDVYGDGVRVWLVIGVAEKTPGCGALAAAWLAVTRAALVGPPAPGQPPDAQLITSANEIRRMFAALCGPPRDEQHARRWSRWRHRHQERARHCHYQRQRQQYHQAARC
jgi:hypothetical protein